MDAQLLLLLSTTTFTPLSLFARGEVGAWYDPNDFLPNWRRNLLTYTEQFDNAIWVKSRVTVTANAAISPDGTVTADKLIPDTANNTHRTYQTNITHGVLRTYTYTCYLKAGEYTFGRLAITDSVEADTASCRFNLSNGTLDGAPARSGAFSDASASVVDAGNGWYRCTLRATCDATKATVSAWVASGSTASGSNSFAGDGTSGIYVWGAQLEVGSTATSYQQIVTPEISYLSYQAQPVMFQNSNGSTPVTAVEQPIGLILDKSKGLVLGSELVANGAIGVAGSATAATYNTSTGAGSVTRVDGENQSYVAWTGLSTNAYKITIQNTAATGSINVRSGGALGTTRLILTAGQSATAYIVPSANQITVTAGTVNTVTFTITTLRELPGNHASQGTDAARPVLSSRVNLLTYSEQADNAAWGKGNATVTANQAVAPDGTTTMDKFVEALDVAQQHDLNNLVTLANATTYVMSVYLKAAERTIVRMLASGSAYSGAGTTAERSAFFDLSNGTVSNIGSGLASASIQAVGNGIYRCTIVDTTTSAAAGGPTLTLVSTGTTTTYNGDGTSGIYVWGADLRAANDGVGLPTYQRIAAATDYDTVGFPLYLRFDGTDDSLATSSIDFTSTDKMTVWAGARKLSDAATGMAVELSASRLANAGSFSLLAPNGAAANYAFFSKGTIDPSSAQNATTYSAPTTNILTGSGDISGDRYALRVNGEEKAVNTQDQGTGNYGNYPLYIGLRASTSLPFNGRLYGLIVRGARSSAAEIMASETWMNQRTRAY